MMKFNLLLWRPWEDRGCLKRCRTEKPTRRQKTKKAEWVTPFSHVHIFLHSTVCFRVPDSCFPQFARSPFLIVSASYNNGELIFKSLQLSLNKKSSGQYHTLWTKQTNQKSNYGCVFGERRLPELGKSWEEVAGKDLSDGTLHPAYRRRRWKPILYFQSLA